MEIKQLLEKTQRGSSVSRALINRCHIHLQKIPRPHEAKKWLEYILLSRKVWRWTCWNH